MAIKCHCGYECRLPGEAEALEQYGCAKTVSRREGPFGAFQLIQCSQEDRFTNKNPELPPIDNGEQFKDAYAKRFEKGGKEDPRKN
jgi:hypothetical protein